MEESKKNILSIIDIDGMFYHSATDTLEKSIEKFKEKFQNILDETQCTHYVGFYSNGRYFRHEIDPEYKGNRKKSIPSKWLKTLKNWAITEYGFQYMNKVEADDLCAYWMNKGIVITTDSYMDTKQIIDSANSELTVLDRVNYQIVEKILVSPDKDLIKSIEGKHFNYSYKLTDEAKLTVKEAKKLGKVYKIKDEDVIKGWYVETTQDEANKFKLSQLIIGDTADNVKGVEKLGLKYWERMVENNAYYLDNILLEYCQKYGISQGIYNFQKNYRTLHMLDCDEDFVREVGKLPEFPIITEIQKEIINNEITF